MKKYGEPAHVDSGTTILIVGDDPADLQKLVNIIEAQNYLVLVAHHGDAGLERAKRDRPDLILVDVMTQGIQGFEMCSNLKRSEKTRDIPVIIVTPVGDNKAITMGFNSGAIDFITKPFLCDEVSVRLKTQLLTHSAQNQLQLMEIRLREETEKRRWTEMKLNEQKAQRNNPVQTERSMEFEFKLDTELEMLCNPILNPSESTIDIRVAILKSAKVLTQSPQGYISKIDPVTGDINVHSFSEMMTHPGNFQKSKTMQLRIPRQKDDRYAELWGHCLDTKRSFYNNSPDPHPSFEGFLQEHFPTKRFLAAPLTIAGKPVGQISLTNKKEDYTNQDLIAIELLGELYAIAENHDHWEKAFWESERKKLQEEERIRQALLSILEDETLTQKKLKASEEALKESQRRLRSLSSHLLNAQEKQWRRLAFELHDELGQSLTVLKLQLREIKKMSASDLATLEAKCHDVNAFVDHIIENVRRISHELCPSCIEDLGLDESIIMLIEELTKHINLNVTTKTQQLNKLFNLNEKTFIYRIVQESLNNILKHANASKVSVTIVRQRTQVVIQIADDGIGFHKGGIYVNKQNNVGLGLTAMGERARMLGGRMQVYSIIGIGTRIEIKIPIEGRKQEVDNLSHRLS